MDFDIVWFGIIVAGAIAYVAYRLSMARRRGENGHAVVKEAIADGLSVVGAGLVGFCVFAVLSFVGMAIMFGGAGHSRSAEVLLLVVIVAALAALFGMPLTALGIRVRRRRRSLLRQ